MYPRGIHVFNKYKYITCILFREYMLPYPKIKGGWCEVNINGSPSTSHRFFHHVVRALFLLIFFTFFSQFVVALRVHRINVFARLLKWELFWYIKRLIIYVTPNQIHIRLMSPTSFEKNECVLYLIILDVQATSLIDWKLVVFICVWLDFN